MTAFRISRQVDRCPTLGHIALQWNLHETHRMVMDRYPSLQEWKAHLRPINIDAEVESVTLVLGVPEQSYNAFYVGITLALVFPPHIKIIMQPRKGATPDQRFMKWKKQVSQARLYEIEAMYEEMEKGFKHVPREQRQTTSISASRQGGRVDDDKMDRIWTALTKGGKYEVLKRAGLVKPGYYTRRELGEEIEERGGGDRTGFRPPGGMVAARRYLWG